MSKQINTDSIYLLCSTKKKRNCSVNCRDFECSSQLSKHLTIIFFMNTKQSLVRPALCFLNHSASGWLQSSRSVVSRLLLIKLKSSTLITSTVCHIRRSTVRELCNWLVKVNRWSVNCSVSLWVSGDDLITDQLNMNEFILQ